MEPLARIPEPPETFLLGHLLTLSATSPVQDMVKIARELGPIYRLEIRGRIVIGKDSFPDPSFLFPGFCDRSLMRLRPCLLDRCEFFSDEL